jgi:hypothetical protein
MIKFLIGLVIVVGLAMGGWQLYQYWGTFKDKEAPAAVTASVATDAPLTGMNPKLEPALEAARQRGATGLRDFLKTYGRGIADPRKASIELDYVVLVAQTNPGEARRVYAKVKERVGPNSPVYTRVKQLEKTYQ